MRVGLVRPRLLLPLVIAASAAWAFAQQPVSSAPASKLTLENYFDLEDPVSLARLEEPMTALGNLEGLVVIDEVQRRPELFPVLRVLIDRMDNAARFLILGSASGDLLRQSSESPAPPARPAAPLPHRHPARTVSSRDR